jgi:integrase
MLPNPAIRVPKYRLHKPKGLGVVRLNGKDIYLGKHGTAESHAEYRRVISEWLASHQLSVGSPMPAAVAASTLTVNELMLAYLRFAKGYYVKNGQPTGEVHNMKDAVKPLVLTHGHISVAEFGPIALKAVRQAMIDADLSRGVVNARVNRIRRVFKWGVENQLVPPAVLQGLQAVTALKRGRSDAREMEAVKPVADAVVEATKQAAPSMLAAMIGLHQLTGMRPGELVVMRTCDIDTTGAVWSYRPSTHKTEHHGRARVISIGPHAQAILRPYLKTEFEAFIFNPQKVMEERRQTWRAQRVTPLTPSQLNRKLKLRPRRSAGTSYTTVTYARAIAYACDAAFPHSELAEVRRSTMTPEQRQELRAWQIAHRWAPNQLRHSAATKLRKQFGIEGAQVVLGHSTAAVTEVYAERDLGKAAEIMARVG